MRLEQSFEVPVPVAQAWSVLLDVERIAPCMPGATLTGFDGTGFTGLVKVKLGPVVLTYKGNGRFVERDESARRVVIVASGQDTRGAGGAQATITATLQPERDAATQVNVVAEVDIAGRAAQFGRGMIADVNRKLIKQFADCLAETIGAQPAAVAPSAPSTSAPASPAPAPAEPAASAPPSAPVQPTAPPAPPPAPAVGQPIPVPPVAEVPAPEVPAPVASSPPPSAAPETAPAARPAEGEPIDLLAVTGAKGMARRAAPIIAIVLIIVVAVIVFFALS
jgi:carbon monoxide dehydrogenase subunit G